jgi:hypothetical protein
MLIAAPQTYITGGELVAVVVGDFNADGLDEVIALDSAPPAGDPPQNVIVLLNQCN